MEHLEISAAEGEEELHIVRRREEGRDFPKKGNRKRKHIPREWGMPETWGSISLAGRSERERLPRLSLPRTLPMVRTWQSRSLTSR